MASPIERLPAELLDVISGQLGCADLAFLIQCSKHLHYRIEPVLYASQTALDKAMLWACKNGKLPTIRLTVSYGADVSIVHVPRRVDPYVPFPDEVQPFFQVLTLHLAARKHHVDAFALLLELGAQIDEIVDSYQLKHLMERLSVNKLLLDQFLKAGLGSQLRERPNLGISLVSVIQRGGSVDVVRQLLDNGADAKRLDRLRGAQGFATPLSAAIKVNSATLFNFFIERGADIHGEDVADVRYAIKPLHIPVFAAARAMAMHGLEMMQRCLDLGVDINHRPSIRNRIHNPLVANTPLLVYLDSIDSWKSPMKLRPIDGLVYLLKHHAEMKFETPQPLEFLFDKWGLAKLADPEFFAAISFLVENGASKFQTRRILSKYDSQFRHSGVSFTITDEIVHAWRSFVELLLKFREEPVMIDELLRHFIREKRELGRLERCTVDCLLRAGANINVIAQPRGGTILHDLACAATYEASGMCIGAPPGVTLSFFSFLIDRGADPTIVVDGRTAVDILREAMARGRILDGRERNLLNLANLLKGRMAIS